MRLVVHDPVPAGMFTTTVALVLPLDGSAAWTAGSDVFAAVQIAVVQDWAKAAVARNRPHISSPIRFSLILPSCSKIWPVTQIEVLSLTCGSRFRLSSRDGVVLAYASKGKPMGDVMEVIVGGNRT